MGATPKQAPSDQPFAPIRARPVGVIEAVPAFASEVISIWCNLAFQSRALALSTDAVRAQSRFAAAMLEGVDFDDHALARIAAVIS